MTMPREWIIQPDGPDGESVVVVPKEDADALVAALEPFATIPDRLRGHRGESPLYAVIDEAEAARDALVAYRTNG
jgi:hypothetical protein